MNQIFRSSLRCGLTATFVPLILSAALTAAARADTLYSIRPTAERTVIRADGVATTVISAQVYDEHGGLAADGTRVRFNTTAGRFDAAVVATQNGIARATLTSADQPGTATVQLILDAAGQATPSVITITFSNDATIAETGSSWIHVDGQYTAYATDFEGMRLLQANGSHGRAQISYHGLTITGDIIQLDLVLNVVTVRGNAKLHVDGVTREYRDLSYDLMRGTGNGQRLDDGQLKTFTVQGAKLDEMLRPAGPPYLDPQTFAFEDFSNGFFTVVATTIAVQPNVVLQFHNATIYGNGYKFKFKNYVLDWNQKTLYTFPLVGYGPSGPTFDIPYDYDVQTDTRGTLHLRHGAQVGSSVYSVRPGWSLDAIQTYNGPHSIDGTVEVDGLGRGDWSAQLHHSQKLDDQTTGSLFVQAPSVDDLFLTSQVTRTYKTFQLNLLGSGSRTGAVVDPTTGVRGNVGGDARGQVTAQTFGKPFFNIRDLQYVIVTGISRQGFYGGDTAVSQGIVDTQQLSSRVYTPTLTIAPRLSIAQSVTVGQNWVEGSAARSSGISGSGISVLGTTTFTRTFGPLGSGNLAYNYAQTPEILTSGLATAATADNAKHRLSLGVNFGKGQIWNLSFNGSRALDIDQSSLFSVLGFSLGGPTRASLTLNDTRAAGIQYTDLEYRLTRIILAHGFSLYYSTTYKRLQLDTAAITF